MLQFIECMFRPSAKLQNKAVRARAEVTAISRVFSRTSELCRFAVSPRLCGVARRARLCPARRGWGAGTPGPCPIGRSGTEPRAGRGLTAAVRPAERHLRAGAALGSQNHRGLRPHRAHRVSGRDGAAVPGKGAVLQEESGGAGRSAAPLWVPSRSWGGSGGEHLHMGLPRCKGCPLLPCPGLSRGRSYLGPALPCVQCSTRKNETLGSREGRGVAPNRAAGGRLDVPLGPYVPCRTPGCPLRRSGCVCVRHQGSPAQAAGPACMSCCVLGFGWCRGTRMLQLAAWLCKSPR